jgi:hypothetical protein
MIRMKIAVGTLGISVACGAFTGCQVLKRHNLEVLGSITPPPRNAATPTAGYEFISESSQQYKSLIYEPEFEEALHPYFNSLEKGNAGKDLHMTVEYNIFRNIAGSVSVLASLVSLGLIPGWDTITHKLTCTVKTAAGAEYEYVLEDYYTTIFGVVVVPYVILVPMENRYQPVEFDHMSGRMRQNLYRHLILQMRDDGILHKAVSK